MEIVAVAALCAVFGTSVQAQSIPPSTSGVVYLRSDTIAYPANYVPASGLPNAQISLSGNSTTTDGAGMFSIPSSTTPTRDSVPLTATLPGYIGTWYPWLPDDATQPIGIGVYPEAAAVPRPGFVNGIIPHDMGPGLPGLYAQGLFASTFDRIKDVAGGNLVVFVDPAWVTSYNVSTNSVTMGTGPLNANWGMASRSMYETMVGQAKARGLQFMMMLGIEPDGSLNFYQTGGVLTIPGTNVAFWDAWFAAYRPLVLERTIIARDLGIDYVGLGFNLTYMSTLGAERWRSLIDAMRALGYKGKITYFGMTHGAFGETEFAHFWTPEAGPNDPMAFIRLFDVIGIDIYDGVTKTTPDEVLDRAQSRARIRSSLKAMLDQMSEAPVPIFVMVGTPSVHGGVSNSEYIEPNSLAPSPTRDYQQQADLYQALSEVINESATGNGRVMGLLSWGYHFRDDFTYGLDPGDSAYDKSASVRGKPAEAVLRSWFQRWTMGSRPGAAAPAAIVGAWSTCGNTPDCASVLVFLDNGTYYHIEDATAAQGPTGFERGTYTWNAATRAFTVTTLKDTDGDLGLSRFNALVGLTFNITGDSATLTIPSQSPVTATRVIDPSSIVGAWSADGTGTATDSSVVVFFPNGTYLGMQEGVASGGGIAGIEHGTYVLAPEVRGYVLNAAPGVDTNGNWGLWPRSAMNMRVSSDLRTVTFAENLRTSSATRVGVAFTTMIFTSGWNLAGNSVTAPLDIATAFADTSKVTSIWKWIPNTNRWAFFSPSLTGQALTDYAASKGYDVLTTVNVGEGYWVNAKTAFTVQLPSGTAVASSSFQSMSSGWHLISTGTTETPSNFNTDLSASPPAAGVVPLNINTLWAWNSSQAKWYFYAPSLEAKGGTALSDYITSRSYLNFTAANKTVGPGVGFWVNKP